MSAPAECSVDFERFRLRNLINRLIDMDEVEIHEEPVALADLSKTIESTSKALLFRRAGTECFEMVANVMGARRRLAAALETDEKRLHETLGKRLASPGSVVEVPSAEAPVHQVVLRGEEADLTQLPFHFQHELDGSLYISSAIDFTVDPESGRRNVGARRLSLRNRSECGTNLTAQSHLKDIYRRSVARGQRLSIAFVVGAHPSVGLVAQMPREADELAAISAVRGVPLPVVKCLTSDILVPADVEMVLEGYLDEKGYREPDGPYGEYLGYYGEMHPDPVFHCVAITRRLDALHQTVLHGSMGSLAWSDTNQNAALLTEVQIINLLRSQGIAEPIAVRVVTSAGITQHARVAIRQQRPGQARQVIAALLGVFRIKHLWVFDEDVDVRNDAQCEWAMSTRFQGDRDLVVLSSLPAPPIDPSLDGRSLGARLGFDCTAPCGRAWTLTDQPARAPAFSRQAARFESVRAALREAPMYFRNLMTALGSNDGREVTLALDELRNEGTLGRDENGRYLLHPSAKGETAIVH